MRRIATELRPSVLDQLGLAAALEWQGQEFAARTGIEVDMESCIDTCSISDEVGSSAFRILQESLTNVARHARATRVVIRLAQSGTMLSLNVSDNGIGCPSEPHRGTASLGIIGMRERALACGGEFGISCRPNGGTTVSLRVPIIESAT